MLCDSKPIVYHFQIQFEIDVFDIKIHQEEKSKVIHSFVDQVQNYEESCPVVWGFIASYFYFPNNKGWYNNGVQEIQNIEDCQNQYFSLVHVVIMIQVVIQCPLEFYIQIDATYNENHWYQYLNYEPQKLEFFAETASSRWISYPEEDWHQEED